MLCGSPGYFARRGTPKRLEHLHSHDLISFETLVSAAEWTFGKGKPERTIPVRSRLVVNTAEAAIDAAIAGVGLTRVLSYQVADAIAAGQLALALEAFEPTPWPVSRVYAAQGPLPQKLRAFLDFAAPRLKSILKISTPPPA